MSLCTVPLVTTMRLWSLQQRLSTQPDLIYCPKGRQNTVTSANDCTPCLEEPLRNKASICLTGQLPAARCYLYQLH